MTKFMDTNRLETLESQELNHTLIPQLIALGKEQGYVSIDDILALLPEAENNMPLLEETFAALQGAGVLYVDSASEIIEENRDKTGEKLPNRQDPLVDVDYHDLIGLYLKEAAGLPLLTAEEEVELAKKIKRGHNAREELSQNDVQSHRREILADMVREGQEAFDHLIQSNTRLVISVAKRYQRRGLPLADLIQAGNVGLIRAAKKFDYQRGFKFSTYATWWIRQAVTRIVAEHGRTIRIPVHTSDKLAQLARLRSQLIQRMDREPTFEEMAAETGLSAHKIEDMLRHARLPLSLERPVGFEGDKVLGDFIEDVDTPGPEDEATRTLFQKQIQTMFDQVLPPREARVLRLRYGFNKGKPMSLQEIGDIEGVTRERVRQIEATALRRLRRSNFRKNLRMYIN
jgi:RNA polymerase primary sigma factor